MKVSPSLSLLLAAVLLAGCSSFRVPFYEPTTTSRPAPPSGSAVEVSEDGQKFWIKEGSEDNESQRQADISDCYAYARAQTARDTRIQGDRVDTGRQAAMGGEETSFMTRMDEFELGKQREALFNRCMRAKGYSKG
ncbi:MAG: hypothetical protein QNJ30_24925 [Kiloniellales bacterium]|nr:hypothetical protein [Kiloniellales bacterium]